MGKGTKHMVEIVGFIVVHGSETGYYVHINPGVAEEAKACEVVAINKIFLVGGQNLVH